MSKARLVIAAVEVEHRPIRDVARDYRDARSWIHTSATSPNVAVISTHRFHRALIRAVGPET